MNQGGLKNMVVLKNLPSNIVEEAIIVLKTNKKIKQVEKIEKEMMEAAKELDFERATELRDILFEMKME